MLIIINGCGIAMNVKKRAHSSFMAPFSCRVLDKMMLHCPSCSTEEAFGCEALKGAPFPQLFEAGLSLLHLAD